MKRLLYITLAILACISSVNGQNVSVVNGIWERGRAPETMKLYAIENGSLRELASSQVNENGGFLFAFSPKEEGFFVIGPNTLARNRYTFYFKPGDQLNVKILPDGSELFGENTPENIEMAKWHGFVEPMVVKVHGSGGSLGRGTFEDFFPLLVEKETAFNNYPAANTPNTKFNTLFTDFKKADFTSLPVAYMFTMRSVHPTEEQFPDFYRNLSLEDLTKDDFLLGYPDGVDLISRVYMRVILGDTTITAEKRDQFLQNPASFILVDPRIKSPVIKGELALRFARNNRTTAGLNEFLSKYGILIQTESQKERLRAIEIAIFANAEGNDAIDFSFPDQNGNMVALSDFKGKVVYIDVWATWCGPCKREIPHLLKLKEEYKDNENIVFMCVSVDASRDKQKWAEFIVTEGMSGVQLFAGDDAQKALMEPYSIMGIPRFILIGKDGRVILANAPAPSSNEIRAILNEALER
jgi:thiol-disulfide isomerase/thioredoxin